MNIFDNGRLPLERNGRFAVNAANWLTSSKAQVLIYSNDILPGWGYRVAPSIALNDLGIFYHLTVTPSFFNLSLNLYSYDLIIFDSPFMVGTQWFEEIQEFVEMGGRVLMSYYNVDSTTNPLWLDLGFAFAEDMPNHAPLHIWDQLHPIFNIPNDYGAMNFTSNRDIGDEGDLLVPVAGATALAGNTETSEVGKAQIILANDDRTLYNGFLLDQLYGDLDDSTYKDTVELWENEIAFMMRPVVDNQANVTYEGGTTGHTISWSARSRIPATYSLLIDGVEESSGAWEESPIITNVDGLTPGTHEAILVATDDYGFTDNGTTYVIVYDTILPTLNSPVDMEFVAGSTVTVTWDANDLFPGTYRLYINGTQEETGAWDGSDITVSVEELEVGEYNFTIMAIDTSGNNASDTVFVTITQGLFGLDTTTLILIAGVGIVGVIIIAALVKKRGGSAPATKPTKKKSTKKKSKKK
jgi:hypothetical protein